ncbi:hypothetical protein J132_07694 [Termitomyces sp. J132]|nr:hypothetical protein J132_07694 [Termitomyces sp. J132]
MAAFNSNFANLSLTLSKVVAFLTSPLDRRTIDEFAFHKLKLNLEAGLTALYAPTWRVDNPLHKSGNRRLSLSPMSLPPQPIYDACVSAGLQWCDWMAALGNVGFDLYADPGCVSICYHSDNAERHITGGKYTTIWVDVSSPTSGLFAPVPRVQKTFAQKILENDHEDTDHLFRMIAHETRIQPTSIHVKFPTSTRSLSPQSATSEHSRSSSRSSNSSSTFSSDASSITSLSTASSVVSPLDFQQSKQSRRERVRQGRVFVDRSKNVVTPYDGGKTTVLTGGVMLGGARYAAPRPSETVNPTSTTAASWRSA